MKLPKELTDPFDGGLVGVVEDLPFAEYHAVEALSSGGIDKMLRSPAHYLLDRTQPREATLALRFGIAVHCGVLEPNRFDDAVVGEPTEAPERPTAKQRYARKPSASTLEAIDFWNSFDAAHAGKVVLSAEDFERCAATIDAVVTHRAARKLLDEADQREVSLFWSDRQFEVPCKARPDLFTRGGIADLKTTRDASPRSFARDAANFHYHVHAAHRFSGCEHLLDGTPRFYVLIAVESEPPHGVACYDLPGNAIMAGAHLVNIALERYREVRASGVYRGYPETIEALPFPRWATTFDL